MNRAMRRQMERNGGIPQVVQKQERTAEFYHGVVPPPAMLKAFDDVNPSYSGRIFKMAEDAGERQMKQLLNQERQIELDAQNRKLEIEASERLKAMEIKSRDHDLMFKNIIATVGLVAGIAVCGVLLYMSFVLLQSDRTGSALVTASPVIGAALLSAIKIFRK